MRARFPFLSLARGARCPGCVFCAGSAMFLLRLVLALLAVAGPSGVRAQFSLCTGAQTPPVIRAATGVPMAAITAVDVRICFPTFSSILLPTRSCGGLSSSLSPLPPLLLPLISKIPIFSFGAPSAQGFRPTPPLTRRINVHFFGLISRLLS